MKNLISQTRAASAALIFGTLVISGAHANEVETKGTNESKEISEIVEEFSLVEISEEVMLLDERPSKVVFFDAENQLILETSDDKIHDYNVEVMLRTADLVLEFDGVKYYYLNR